jgi:spore coat polysaccharide biosynthesis protein SpsF
MPNIHVCLQVRSSSVRLPYKCLLPINKLEVIKILIKRVKSKKYTINILTSNTKSDDYLCDSLKNDKINIYRGDLSNVYKRFIQFSKKFNDNDLIVRITGDNLLVDKYVIEEVIKFYEENNYNYVSINRKKSKLPYGISVELFNCKTLKKWKANNSLEKEHVTTKIIDKEKNQGYFVIKNSNNFYNLRCTLDNIEDYFVIKTVFEKAKNIKLPYLKMCKILNNLKKKDIVNNQKKYSNIILGSAQFDGKYGVSNKQNFNKKNLVNIINIANKIGIKKIDTAYNYKGVHDKIAKSLKGKEFKIISKGSLNLKKKNTFFNQFNETINKFSQNSLEYFLVHNFNEYYQNKKKFEKTFKNNKLIKEKLGISIYSPDELKKINKKLFKIIQIPFNICDMRWKNLKIKNQIIIRSVFLQGIFFCNDNEIPNKIKTEVKKIRNKLNFLVKKYKKFDLKDLLISYVNYFNFKGIIIGVDNETQLKEIFFYINRPKLRIDQVREIQKLLSVSLNVVDPRKWY